MNNELAQFPYLATPTQYVHVDKRTATVNVEKDLQGFGSRYNS